MSETSDTTTTGNPSTANRNEQTTITEHVEPLAQGGKRYVRCEACGRELLCALGGRTGLPHTDECPLGEADR